MNTKKSEIKSSDCICGNTTNITDRHFTQCPMYVELEVVKQTGLPHDQLLKALYWVFDFMDRALINVYLVGETAKAVKGQQDLSGDKIQVAVRRLEWESGARRIADAFATPVEDKGITVDYQFEGVPITIYVLEDSATLTNFDTQIYYAEYFKTPNPYDQFEKEFGGLIV